MCGVNSHGIAFYGNTLYARGERPGMPNFVKHRWLLEAATRAEADARACMRGRARGSNHLNAEAGGAIWDLEVSSERAVTIEADGWLVYVDIMAAEMQDVERSEIRGIAAAVGARARADGGGHGYRRRPVRHRRRRPPGSRQRADRSAPSRAADDPQMMALRRAA